MTLTPGMLDVDLRIKAMDEAGIDLAIVSLTCPNVYWGGREASLQAARAIILGARLRRMGQQDFQRWTVSPSVEGVRRYD